MSDITIYFYGIIPAIIAWYGTYVLLDFDICGKWGEQSLRQKILITIIAAIGSWVTVGLMLFLWAVLILSFIA